MKALLLVVSLAFQLGPASDIPNLVRNLKDPDNWQVRLAAARALGNYGAVAKDAVPALIECLNDDALVDTAAWSLGEIGPDARDAAPQLIVLARLSAERRRQTVLNAIEALGKLGPAAYLAIRTLEDLSLRKRDIDPMVVHAARLALVALGPEGKKHAARIAINDLRYETPVPDVAVREEAAGILLKTGEFATPYVPEMIEAMHEDKSPVVLQLLAQT